MSESTTANSALAHHFDNMEQQREAGTLGMWAFLVTEIMFFGGLFLAYTIFRSQFPREFAEASQTLDIRLGAFNTAVLIGSSLTMALAVYYSQIGKKKALITCLVLTILLGGVFLGVKAVEYRHKWEEHHIPGFGFQWEGGHKGADNQEAPTMRSEASITERIGPDRAAAGPSVAPADKHQMFFWIYFAMTGLHALHMIIGIGIMVVLIWMAVKNRFSPDYHAPVEISGLYWHFVDIVWIFLFPLLYLIDRHR